MRFLQLNVKPEAVHILREVYETRVFPELQKIKGCSFACLIRGIRRPGTVISMTLWQRKEDAETFGKSPFFQEIMKEAAPFLSESPETDAPAREEPGAKSYSVKTEKQMKSRARQKTTRMRTRIVSFKIGKEKIDAFTGTYNREIIPALQTVDGCLHAYLMERVQEGETREMISVTMWESGETAEQYEQDPRFDGPREKEEGKGIKTGDNTATKRFTVITGEQFGLFPVFQG